MCPSLHSSQLYLQSRQIKIRINKVTTGSASSKPRPCCKLACRRIPSVNDGLSCSVPSEHCASTFHQVLLFRVSVQKPVVMQCLASVIPPLSAHYFSFTHSRLHSEDCVRQRLLFTSDLGFSFLPERNSAPRQSHNSLVRINPASWLVQLQRPLLQFRECRYSSSNDLHPDQQWWVPPPHEASVSPSWQPGPRGSRLAQFNAPMERAKPGWGRKKQGNRFVLSTKELNSIINLLTRRCTAYLFFNLH